jgi:adenosylcobinamide-phosphate synthase
VSRVAVLGLAVLWDLAFAEPPTALHPVVWIGRLVSLLERRAPRDRPAAELAYGALTVALALGAAAGLAGLVERRLARAPLPLRLVGAALALKPSFALRALFDAGEAVRRPLAGGDLGAARRALRGLVSRETAELSAELVAAAAVESLAENASDSAVAPCLYYLVGGLPAAYAYRAANTLDAMIGYRGRYEWLGKPAARLDDLLNLVPARLTALFIALGSPRPGRALSVLRRDHARTASPNAGWPMSAMAGALGVRLEKVGHYRLGDPLRPIEPSDIARAAGTIRRGLRLGAAVAVAAAVLSGR